MPAIDHRAPPGVAATLDGRVGPPVARNMVWLGGAQVVALLLHLVWFGLLSSRLGPAGLGVYVFAVAIPDLLGPVVDFGFKAIVARDVAQDPTREPSLVPNLFYLRLTLALVSYGLAVGFLHVVGYHPATTRAATVAAVIAVLVTVQSFQVGLEVRLRMGWVATANLAEAVTLVVGVILLIHRHAGVLAFVWLYVGANGLSLAIVAFRALRLVPFHWAPEASVLAPVVRAALPLGAAGVITGLYYRLDILVLARAHSAAAVGQYGAGYRFLDAVAVFPGLVVSLLNPVFARSAARGVDELRRRYSTVTHLATVPSVMLGIGGAMTAWRALPALHAFRHYHGGGAVLAILAPAAGLMLIGSVLSGVLFSSHQQRLLLVVALAVLGLSAALDFTLIPAFSYIGAAVATTAGEAASVVALAWVAHRRLGVSWPLDRLAQTLAAGGILAGVIGAGYLLPPLPQLALGLATVPVAVVATRALTRTDVAVLRRDVAKGMLP